MTTAGAGAGVGAGSGPDWSTVSWRRAAACAESSCVEVAASPDAVAVRDSKDGGRPPLVFSRAEWVAFVDGVRRGDFDDL